MEVVGEKEKLGKERGGGGGGGDGRNARARKEECGGRGSLAHREAEGRMKK